MSEDEIRAIDKQVAELVEKRIRMTTEREQGLTPGETDFDETEVIEVEEYTLDELLAMIKTGEIHDGKTATGIALARLEIK